MNGHVSAAAVQLNPLGILQEYNFLLLLPTKFTLARLRHFPWCPKSRRHDTKLHGLHRNQSCSVMPGDWLHVNPVHQDQDNLHLAKGSVFPA